MLILSLGEKKRGVGSANHEDAAAAAVAFENVFDL